MKLLFDENLSPSLVILLIDIFPESVHVRDIGMKASEDKLVWEYAKDKDFIIVSKDVDIHDLSLVYGSPPKVIWLKLGNCSTKQVEEVLRSNYANIQRFYILVEFSCICLTGTKYDLQ